MVDSKAQCPGSGETLRYGIHKSRAGEERMLFKCPYCWYMLRVPTADGKSRLVTPAHDPVPAKEDN